MPWKYLLLLAFNTLGCPSNLPAGDTPLIQTPSVQPKQTGGKRTAMSSSPRQTERPKVYAPIPPPSPALKQNALMLIWSELCKDFLKPSKKSKTSWASSNPLLLLWHLDYRCPRFLLDLHQLFLPQIFWSFYSSFYISQPTNLSSTHDAIFMPRCFCSTIYNELQPYHRYSNASFW